MAVRVASQRRPSISEAAQRAQNSASAHEVAPVRGATVAHRLPGAEPPIQRELKTWTDLKTNASDSVSWAPHKTQPTLTEPGMGPLPATRASGVGAAIVGTMQADSSWRHTVALKPATKFGGTGVAGVLGPGAPAGTVGPPDWKVPALLSAAANNAPYATAAILPHWAGGDESAIANAIAMPAASVGALNFFHDRLKRLTVAGHSWVNTDISVGYQNGSVSLPAPPKLGFAQPQPPVVHLFSYASTITAAIKEYKLNLFGQAEISPSGQTHVSISIPAPSAVGGGTQHAFEAPQYVPGTTNPNKALTADADFRRENSTLVGEWRTAITFGPTANGDGTEMTASPLGPDHKVGEEPVNSRSNKSQTVWAARVGELSKKAGKKPYVAGHLLNHHLGGPGNDARNLAPIPAEANDKHESQVESVIKDLVNGSKRWVHYHVRVTHGNDSGTSYPNAFICEWWQLDQYGRQIAGTRGNQTIAIPPPSAYGNATVTPNNEADAATAAIGGAETILTFDQVVLDDSGTLKYQRRVMTGLVTALRPILTPWFRDPRVQAKTKAFLAAAAPDAVEAKIFGDIALVTDTAKQCITAVDIKKHAAAISDDLKRLMAGAEFAIDTRLKRMQTASQAQMEFTESVKGPIRLAISGAIEADLQHFAVMKAVVNELLRLVAVASEAADSAHSELAKAAEYLQTWIGAAASGQSDPPNAKDLIALAQAAMKRALEPVSTPMSPSQASTVAETSTGTKPDSELAARQALARHVVSSFGASPSMSAFVLPPRKYNDTLLFLLCRDGKLAEYTESNGEVAKVALALKSVSSNKDAAIMTIKSLYRTQTALVNAYVEFLETVVPDFATYRALATSDL